MIIGENKRLMESSHVHTDRIKKFDSIRKSQKGFLKTYEISVSLMIFIQLSGKQGQNIS